jgi:hypothetical protein
MAVWGPAWHCTAQHGPSTAHHRLSTAQHDGLPPCPNWRPIWVAVGGGCRGAPGVKTVHTWGPHLGGTGNDWMELFPVTPKKLCE